MANLQEYKFDPALGAVLAQFCPPFQVYWQWKTLSALNTYLGEDKMNPMIAFAGLICPLATLFVNWKLASELFPALYQKGGLGDKQVGGIELIIYLCLMPLVIYKEQDTMNKLWDAAG